MHAPACSSTGSKHHEQLPGYLSLGATQASFLCGFSGRRSRYRSSFSCQTQCSQSGSLATSSFFLSKVFLPRRLPLPLLRFLFEELMCFLRCLIFSVIHCASPVSKTRAPPSGRPKAGLEARFAGTSVVKRSWSGPRPYAAAARLSAEDFPVFRSRTISYESFCPSLRFDMPARSTALIWTNTSLLPSSGWMKP